MIAKMISLVVPIYNEQENLPELRRRVTATLDSTGHTWELILVNDGSRDASEEMIRQYHSEDPRIKLVNLSRNFGHQPAVTAGIHHARGDCVVLMDGDMQDPPEVIAEMVRTWEGGAQVVLGERRSRQDKNVRGVGFRLFYPVFRFVSGLPAPDAGIFGLMDRVVVEKFNRLPERNRFIPGLRGWLGFKQGSVLYDRQDRAAGAPKQTFSRLFRYATDAMFSFSYKPLRWVTKLGMMVSIVTFLLAVFYLVQFIATRGSTYGSGFTTIIMCMLFLGGVQLVAIGILGEYIARIYEEVKQRPLYVVRDVAGIETFD